MSDRAPMTRGDWRFCEWADEFKDCRHNIVDHRVCPLRSGELLRFTTLCYNLLLEIRRRRPDLEPRALAELSLLHALRMPSDGELLLLVEDATDVIGETLHAITTGRVGEYIDAACPSLRLDRSQQVQAAPAPLEAKAPKGPRGRPRTEDTPQELAIHEHLQRCSDWYAIAAQHGVSHDEVERVYDKFRARKSPDHPE